MYKHSFCVNTVFCNAQNMSILYSGLHKEHFFFLSQRVQCFNGKSGHYWLFGTCKNNRAGEYPGMFERGGGSIINCGFQRGFHPQKALFLPF